MKYNVGDKVLVQNLKDPSNTQQWCVLGIIRFCDALGGGYRVVILENGSPFQHYFRYEKELIPIPKEASKEQIRAMKVLAK